jgi:Fe-Mn family superoxide dismutase
MKFELNALPYTMDALEPYMSARTLEFHYGKHHAGYLKKLEAAIKGTPQAELDLDEIVRKADDVGVFRNAAQTWNHTFFWNGMCPPKQHQAAPSGTLASAIERDLGGVDKFRQSFAEIAGGQFGSGWAWLVADGDGHLQVISTHDADNPMRDSLTPILTLDVWEHAYYLDYQNERPKYIEAYLDHLINWEFAQRNFDAAHVAVGSA